VCSSDLNSLVVNPGVIANATAYRYYWLKLEGRTAGGAAATSDLYIAQAQFLETVNTYADPALQVVAYEPYGSDLSSTAVANWEGALTYDDNKHGSAPNPASFATNPALNSAPPKGYWHSTFAWSTNHAFAYRGEIERALTPVASGANAGNYAYRIVSWIRDCNNNNCLQYVNATSPDTNMAFFSDTSRFLCANHLDADYNTNCTVDNFPILDNTIYLTPAQHANFTRMIFGFTEATGGATQTATYSYFTLQFMKPNDYAAGGVKRRVINRVIN
jgi:hypothetical protein